MSGRSSFLRGFAALAFGAMFAPAIAMADPLSITPPVPGSSSFVKATLTTTEATPEAKTQTKEHYNVVVFGDSLGDGVWAGLYHVLHKDKRFSVIRKSRVATGFVRQDYYDWNQAVRDAAADTRIDIAVVVMGTNDRQTIVEDGARYALFEPKWREIYEARVDDFTETLKKSGARIYWVGLPVMRSATFESDMETFTQIFEARAKANDVTFIPTHDLAADKDGKYDAYRTDAGGRKRLLRAEDGIHFTMDGYELLARKIGDTISADVDSGAVASKAPAEVLSTAAAQEAAKVPVSTASIGLKTQVYDVAEVRPGRSDDWRWTGAAR
jgi:hypothetical protein